MQNNRALSTNKYDKLIMLLISLQAFGLIGGALQPVRIFAYCCVPFVISYFFKNRKAAKYYRYEISYFIFWCFYALISLLWVIDLDYGTLYLYHLVVSICVFFTLIWLVEKANKPQESIIKGWILLFALTLPIALFELTYDWHLPMAIQEEGHTIRDAVVVYYRRFASVTFGNLNTYNLVLCYSLSFLLLAIAWFKKKLHLFINSFLLLFLCYIVILNSSRGAVLTLFMGVLLFLMYYFIKEKRRVLVMSFIFIVAFFIIQNVETLFEVILFRFERSGFEDPTRSLLLVHSLDALWNSNLMGVGVGNMRPVMESVYNMNVSVVHNLFLEILLQYGVLIFMGFVFLLWRIIKRGLMPGNRTISRWFVLLAMCILILGSIIDASYLPKVYIWLFLVSVSVVVDRRYNYEYGSIQKKI